MLDDGEVLPPPPVLMSAAASEDERVRVADAFDAAQEARVRSAALARAALSAAAEADRDAAAALRAGDSLGALLAALVPGSSLLLFATSPLEAIVRAQRERLLDAIDGREIPQVGDDPA